MSDEKDTVQIFSSEQRRRRAVHGKARLRSLFLDCHHRSLLRSRPHALPLRRASGRAGIKIGPSNLIEYVNQVRARRQRREAVTTNLGDSGYS